jgi:hypothetical protein
MRVSNWNKTIKKEQIIMGLSKTTQTYPQRQLLPRKVATCNMDPG